MSTSCKHVKPDKPFSEVLTNRVIHINGVQESVAQRPLANRVVNKAWQRSITRYGNVVFIFSFEFCTSKSNVDRPMLQSGGRGSTETQTPASFPVRPFLREPGGPPCRTDIRKYVHRGNPPDNVNPTRELLGPITINSDQKVGNRMIQTATVVSAAVLLMVSGAQWKRRVSR